jgi:hemoglobin-like flavoprotein
MLSAAEKAALRESWQLLEPVADAAADLFYQRLVQQQPTLWPASHSELAARKHEFVALFSFVMETLAWDDNAWREEVADERDLFLTLLDLGRRKPPLVELIHEHYGAVGEALLGALRYALGKRFDEGTQAAWSRLYKLLANALRLGRISAAPSSARASADDCDDASQRPTREDLANVLSTLRRGASS